jgi:hypothetical protein
MAQERRNHTLQPTALINEAYVRLVHMRQPTWQNRAHFFALSAQIMRRILVDFARARLYQKRGGGAGRHAGRRAADVETGSRRVARRCLAALAAIDAREVASSRCDSLATERRGNRASAAGLTEDGHARVADREGVVVEGTDGRSPDTE